MWEPLRDLRQDHLRLTAQYIVNKKVRRSKRGGDRVLSWAKKVVRNTDHALQRIVRLYNFYLDNNNNIKYVCWVQKNNKKKFSFGLVYKYGIHVPWRASEVEELDKENGDTARKHTMDAEVKLLIDLDCFQLQPQGFYPGKDYQQTNLHVIFDVKQAYSRGTFDPDDQHPSLFIQC